MITDGEKDLTGLTIGVKLHFKTQDTLWKNMN